MLPFADPFSRARARDLRRAPTDTEALLWRRIRRKQQQGLRFRRQHPVGPYIVDFACLRPRIIVELDGGQHVDAATYDGDRTTYLQRMGFRVLRFWNGDVLRDVDGVIDAICLAAEEMRGDRANPP